jgi:GNAT superfamily N-acetyltransferase
MTVVACDDQDQSLIMGWLCFELYHDTPVLHYLYVKAIYRNMGVAKELFNSCIKRESYYTHRPDKLRELVHKMTYVPYLRHGEFYGKKDRFDTR